MGSRAAPVLIRPTCHCMPAPARTMRNLHVLPTETSPRTNHMRTGHPENRQPPRDRLQQGCQPLGPHSARS
eukprot:12878859-Alexandrium_andersonii.AAC.1